MTDPQDKAVAADRPALDREASRRRIAEIFGDVLPGTTRDERDPEGASGNDRRISDDVPPHWQ